MSDIKIVGLGGSLAERSKSLAALKVAIKGAAEADAEIGLISTAGGVQGLQAVNTMEFSVRALRGWTVPMVIPIPRAWQVFDETGQMREPGIEGQLKALGREVVRAARQFALDGYNEYSVPMEALVD